jgi:divalent metal cation (Fe/Co/Zn/Cd) transporter
MNEWVRTTRNAELVVVLGEDLAAIFGLALAFVFLGLATLTGDTTYDAAGSICIGAVLIVVSVFVATRIKSLIIGRSAEPKVRATIAAVLAADGNIVRVFNTLTIQFGPQVMLAAKLQLRPGTPIEVAVDQINALERRLKEAIPQLGWCFIEPDDED